LFLDHYDTRLEGADQSRIIRDKPGEGVLAVISWNRGRHPSSVRYLSLGIKAWKDTVSSGLSTRHWTLSPFEY